MFSVNDDVLYGSQGLCKVTDLIDKDFGNGVSKYYVLTPEFQNKSTIFVPADNEKLLSKVRKVLSEEEIMALIKNIPEKDTVWIDNDSERQRTYQKVISGGDREGIFRIIKTFYFTKQELAKMNKKLYKADEQIYKEAEKILYDEFALVLGIKPSEVQPYIFSVINTES